LTDSCKASGGAERTNDEFLQTSGGARRTGNLKPETRSKKLFGGK